MHEHNHINIKRDKEHKCIEKNQYILSICVSGVYKVFRNDLVFSHKTLKFRNTNNQITLALAANSI